MSPTKLPILPAVEFRSHGPVGKLAGPGVALGLISNGASAGGAGEVGAGGVSLGGSGEGTGPSVVFTSGAAAVTGAVTVDRVSPD